LTIIGEVKLAYAIEPPEFLFDKVSVGETKSAQVVFMSLFEDKVDVRELQLSSPDTRKFLDVNIEPITGEAFPNPAAKAGMRITLTAKPGLPVGAFNQQLSIHTNLKDAPSLEIPIVGRVIGDISIHGALWDDQRSILTLGNVRSSEGKRVTLNLVIRGSAAADVKLHVISCDPPELTVSFGAAKRLKDDLAHLPLEIEVPAGTPPIVRLGTAQGAVGRITLGTTHPTVPELTLGVQFVVER
jgi:hypothetical protein